VSISSIVEDGVMSKPQRGKEQVSYLRAGAREFVPRSSVVESTDGARHGKEQLSRLRLGATNLAPEKSTPGSSDPMRDAQNIVKLTSSLRLGAADLEPPSSTARSTTDAVFNKQRSENPLHPGASSFAPNEIMASSVGFVVNAHQSEKQQSSLRIGAPDFVSERSPPGSLGTVVGISPRDSRSIVTVAPTAQQSHISPSSVPEFIPGRTAHTAFDAELSNEQPSNLHACAPEFIPGGIAVDSTEHSVRIPSEGQSATEALQPKFSADAKDFVPQRRLRTLGEIALKIKDLQVQLSDLGDALFHLAEEPADVNESYVLARCCESFAHLSGASEGLDKVSSQFESAQCRELSDLALTL